MASITKNCRDKVMIEFEDKNVVLYARVSTIRQSTNRQIELLKQFCKENALTVVKEFRDCISGMKPYQERVVLNKCIEFCNKHNIRTILITEASRLGRDVNAVIDAMYYLHKGRIRVVSLCEELELHSDMSKELDYFEFMQRVQAAQYEYQYIKHRLSTGICKYRASGGRVGRKKGWQKNQQSYINRYSMEIELLCRGKPIRTISSLTGTSPTTIMKLKKMFVNEAQI